MLVPTPATTPVFKKKSNIEIHCNSCFGHVSYHIHLDWKSQQNQFNISKTYLSAIHDWLAKLWKINVKL